MYNHFSKKIVKSVLPLALLSTILGPATPLENLSNYENSNPPCILPENIREQELEKSFEPCK